MVYYVRAAKHPSAPESSTWEAGVQSVLLNISALKLVMAKVIHDG
jgi:hypothetical protein